jgi:hypothetical protein
VTETRHGLASTNGGAQDRQHVSFWPRAEEPATIYNRSAFLGTAEQFRSLGILRSLTRPDFPPCSERLQPPPLRSRTISAICGHRKGCRSRITCKVRVSRCRGFDVRGGPMLSAAAAIIPALTQPERLAPRSAWTRSVPQPSPLGPSPSTRGLRPSRPARRACDACRRPSPACRRNQPAEQPPSPTSTPFAVRSSALSFTRRRSPRQMRTRCSSPSSLPPSSASAGPCAGPSGSSWASPGSAGDHRARRTGAPRRCRPRTAVNEGLDPAQAHMVGAAVGVGDHRVGLARQFVMQSGGDEAPDDGRRCRVGVNPVVGDTTILTTFGEARCMVLMMSPACRGRARPARL